MKKKHTIKIKDPHLIRARNGLREVLQLAMSAKLSEIIEKVEELQNTEGFWDKDHPNYKKLRKESQELSSQENNLRFAYKASIIKCPVCMSIDKDMTYNPVFKKWYCIECYEANKKFEIEQGHPDLYP